MDSPRGAPSRAGGAPWGELPERRPPSWPPAGRRLGVRCHPHAVRPARLRRAARGQGRSHALRLAQERADVVAVDRCGPVELPVPCVDPVDISDAILFLVSDEARHVTGVTLPVDAGYTIRWRKDPAAPRPSPLTPRPSQAPGWPLQRGRRSEGRGASGSHSGVLVAWWSRPEACGRTRWICVSGSLPQSMAG
ncbi:SDR family oxidoreductase [Geodermatophilus sp. URMC 62]|uniref:SDR family oxidoreductase n=1 Tax=Geodermatophilus sp. URMC 62 TaxID=3423414 RepID=UPI00406C7788